MQSHKQNIETGSLLDLKCSVKTQNGINVDGSMLPLTALPNLQKRWMLATTDELIPPGESFLKYIPSIKPGNL